MGALVLGYLVYGPWKDPMGFNFPQTKMFEPVTQMPKLFTGSRVTIGLPLALLMDPQQLDTIELQFGGRARHVFQYRYQPQRIWGATASILYNLRERLAGSNQWRV